MSCGVRRSLLSLAFLADVELFCIYFGLFLDGASGEARARRGLAIRRCIQPYLLRRLKNSVLNELPPREVQHVECEMGNKQARIPRL